MPDWRAHVGERVLQGAESAQVNEAASREGAALGGGDLLDFTYTASLTRLVLDNYARFEDILGSEVITRGFLTFVQQIRNTPAHSRDLLPHERDLLAGAAGRVQNQVAIWRARNDSPTRYYPLIESVTDDFGRSGMNNPHEVIATANPIPIPRLEVGHVLRFGASAYPARGLQMEWRATFLPFTPFGAQDLWTPDAVGNAVTLEVPVDSARIGESGFVLVELRSSSAYHRTQQNDDARWFQYHVNPPEEE